MKKKHIILTSIVSLILIVASSIWSYNQGLTESLHYEAAKTMLIAKNQYECIKNNDSECIKKTNKLFIAIAGAQLERLSKSNASLPNAKEIEEFIEFSIKTKNEKYNKSLQLTTKSRASHAFGVN